MADQDRRTNMVNSSIKSQPAKGGAGGAFTWGSAMDSQGFVPVGIGANVGVVTQAAPVTQVFQTAPAQAFVMEQQAFPTLGGTQTFSSAPATVSSWGPGMGGIIGSQTINTGTVITDVANVRTGGYSFDASHPRNQFAKQPYVRPATTTMQVAQPQGEQLIDWSKVGMPQAVMQAIVASPNAAAHLGPYQAAAPQAVPLETLRVQNMATQAQFTQYAPTVARPVAQMTNKGARAARVIQQPAQR